MGTTGRTAYIGATILDGTKGMEPKEGMVLVTSGSSIEAIVPEAEKSAYAGCEVRNLKGLFLMPGLINMHVHLAGNGKPQKKQRDNAALVNKIMSNGLTRAVAYRLVRQYAQIELMSGVTTIRTVGASATSTHAAVTRLHPARCWVPASSLPMRASRCREAIWQDRSQSLQAPSTKRSHRSSTAGSSAATSSSL